jgi:peptide deformylase
MQFLEVIPDTDPMLRKTSRRVRHVDDKLRKIIADMYDLMVENWGIGLAAIQVGVQKRFFIYEIPKREVSGYEACYPRPTSGDRASSEKGGASDDGEADSSEEASDGGYSGDYTVCINPRIISREGAYIEDEGCLSRAGWMAKVERAIKVTFEAWDTDMLRFERTVEGLEARCVQHEIDHLDGILFTDRAVPGTLRDVREEEAEREAAEKASEVAAGSVESSAGEKVEDAG